MVQNALWCNLIVLLTLSTGSAGCFVGYASLELYAQAFDSIGKIEMLVIIIITTVVIVNHHSKEEGSIE